MRNLARIVSKTLKVDCLIKEIKQSCPHIKELETHRTCTHFISC
jgi:hypothetical protein